MSLVGFCFLSLDTFSPLGRTSGRDFSCKVDREPQASHRRCSSVEWNPRSDVVWQPLRPQQSRLHRTLKIRFDMMYPLRFLYNQTTGFINLASSKRVRLTTRFESVVASARARFRAQTRRTESKPWLPSSKSFVRFGSKLWVGCGSKLHNLKTTVNNVLQSLASLRSWRDAIIHGEPQYEAVINNAA